MQLLVHLLQETPVALQKGMRKVQSKWKRIILVNKTNCLDYKRSGYNRRVTLIIIKKGQKICHPLLIVLIKRMRSSGEVYFQT